MSQKNAYMLLMGAIVAEVIATTALKESRGFTRLRPSLVCVGGYAAAFWMLAQAIDKIPTGVAYAIWSGVGLILIAGAARVLHGQRLDWPALIGMGLILAGVMVMNLFSRAVAH